MSNDFTDICLSDTDTASSLCWLKGCIKYSRAVNKRFAQFTWPDRGSIHRVSSGVLLQDFRHHLFDMGQLKRFGQVRIAGRLQKGLSLLVDHVAGQENNPPREGRLFANRLLIELLTVHSGHAKIGKDH